MQAITNGGVGLKNGVEKNRVGTRFLNRHFFILFWFLNSVNAVSIFKELKIIFN